MLIVCSGPDTYHARKKARELVAAFRAKHDPTGFSTEIMQAPDLQNFLARIGAPSLFAQKRMIRCDGLLADLKIAEVRQLAKRLEGDQDATIILTVENEPLSSKHEKEFEKIKLIQYASPLLTGATFLSTVAKRAVELGVSQDIAAQISRHCDGDMWRAEHELEKASANPNTQLIQGADDPGSVFDAGDSYLLHRAGWRERVASFPDESMVSILATQARTFSRVRDGETQGVHPYVARKMSMMRISDDAARRRFLSAITALYVARNIATEEEAQALL